MAIDSCTGVDFWVRFVQWDWTKNLSTCYVERVSTRHRACVGKRTPFLLTTSLVTDSFNFEKATQILNVIAQNAGGTINKMKAIKIAFFADRYHIRKFGRTISGDKLVAMKHGPVGSGSRDLLEKNGNHGRAQACEYADEFIESVEDHRFYYRSIQDVDESVLSESELEAIKFAWEKFGSLKEFDLANLTHQYPEWKKYEKFLKNSNTGKYDIAEEDMFDDPPIYFDPCFKLSSEEREIRRQYFQERQRIEALWR